MKYSFIMPVYDRALELYNTLMTYRHWYSDRNDIEVIVIEDGANAEDEKLHDALVDTLYAYGDLNIVHKVSKLKNQYNPVKHRNRAVEMAKGEFIVITNPECVHMSDILGALENETRASLEEISRQVVVQDINKNDQLEEIKRLSSYPYPENYGPDHPDWKIPGKVAMKQKYLRLMAAMAETQRVPTPKTPKTNMNMYGSYVVCACKNCEYGNRRHSTFKEFQEALVFKSWFQSMAKNNRRLHWCSIISKKNYQRIGGFDEKYSKFCGYDDDDFVKIVEAANIPFVVRDDLLVVHQNHGRSHHKNTMSMARAGRAYFNKKWNTNMPMFKKEGE